MEGKLAKYVHEDDHDAHGDDGDDDGDDGDDDDDGGVKYDDQNHRQDGNSNSLPPRELGVDTRIWFTQSCNDDDDEDGDDDDVEVCGGDGRNDPVLSFNQKSEHLESVFN